MSDADKTPDQTDDAAVEPATPPVTDEHTPEPEASPLVVELTQLAEDLRGEIEELKTKLAAKDGIIDGLNGELERLLDKLDGPRRATSTKDFIPAGSKEYGKFKDRPVGVQVDFVPGSRKLKPNADGEFPCPYGCDKTFATQRSLNGHISAVHK